MLNIESPEQMMLRLDSNVSLLVLQLRIHLVTISEKRKRSHIGVSGRYRNVRFVMMYLSLAARLSSLPPRGQILASLRPRNLVRTRS